eukprot:COSAG01_NODE_22349_length_858_cov_1.693421_1_plen_73_part_10
MAIAAAAAAHHAAAVAASVVRWLARGAELLLRLLHLPLALHLLLRLLHLPLALHLRVGHRGLSEMRGQCLNKC